MKKKNIILSIIFIFFIIFLAFLLVLAFKNAKNSYISNSFLESTLKFKENNEETIFSIDKIIYFSSCDANVNTNSNSSFTISDLYQYTDIAIFINPNSEEFTHKNTLKSVVISDISFSLSPTIGKTNLYYKNINDFATSKFAETNLIKDSIVFETTSADKIDYSTPTLYNNCANPITFCYVNSNIIDNHTLSNDISNIAYNGSLLKTCGITLNSISTKLSFVITITNNLEEVYACPLTITIPLSTENSTIYDGSLTLKDSTQYKFIKIN